MLIIEEKKELKIVSFTFSNILYDECIRNCNRLFYEKKGIREAAKLWELAGQTDGGDVWWEWGIYDYKISNDGKRRQNGHGRNLKKKKGRGKW